jgi:hypothetical protein
MSDLQLSRLLDDEQTLVPGDVVKERLHEGRFARTSSAADDPVLLLANQFHDGIPDMRGHTPRLNQLI